MFAAVEDTSTIDLIVQGPRSMDIWRLAMPHLPYSSPLTGIVVFWLLQCTWLLIAETAG